MVRYVVADSPDGPFEKVGTGIFDAEGFYAGRLEKSEDELYVVGWVPTKDKHSDKYGFNWGGNLVVHWLEKENEDGRLKVVPISERKDWMDNHTEPSVVMQTSGIDANTKRIKVESNGFEYITFESMEKQSILDGVIEFEKEDGYFGLTFDAKSGYGDLNIVLNVEEDSIEFYNVEPDKVGEVRPQLSMDYDFEAADRIEFELVVDGSAAVMYINNEKAFSTRMYHMQNREWGLFSVGNRIKVDDLTLHY